MTTSSRGVLPVLILAADVVAGDELAAMFATNDGWLARQPSLDLPRRIGRLLWGFESGAGSAGVSSLAPRGVFYPALRRLTDALLVGDNSIARVGVDVTTDGDRLRPFLPAVWPDAVYVDLPAGGTAPVIEDIVARADAGTPWPVPGPSISGDLRDRLVVVLGAARSGTTWLHRMITAHSRIAGTKTGETWLFPDIAPLWDDVVRDSVGEDRVIAALRGFCDELLLAMRDAVVPEASHVCEKTPATVWRLPMMARLYPDAYYVHVVRDGRDAVLSMANSGFADGDLKAAARTWADAVSRVRGGAADLPRFREIRYEDLLADPAGVVTGLWDWLGIESDDASVAELDIRVGERVTPLEPTGDIGAGKWQSLDRKQRREITSIAGGLLAELGYR